MVLKSPTLGDNLDKFELQLVKNAIGLKKRTKQVYMNQLNGFKWVHISPQQVPERYGFKSGDNLEMIYRIKLII